MAKNETWRRLRVVLAGQEIMATALPQLGKEKECPGNETVTNCGNVVAPIRLPRFTLSWSHYLIKVGTKWDVCIHAPLASDQ